MRSLEGNVKADGPYELRKESEEIGEVFRKNKGNDAREPRVNQEKLPQVQKKSKPPRGGKWNCHHELHIKKKKTERPIGRLHGQETRQKVGSPCVPHNCTRRAG